jgi:two-component system cell cycle sensor histidine kinase/response regulator CckA
MERRQAEAALRESEEKFTGLFSAMVEGVALHKIVYDSSGVPIDYIVLDINPAYESTIGLKRESIVGKRASELYGTYAAPYLELYSKVASSGKPESFETYFPPLNKHFAISVFSPTEGQFATVFQDVTLRKLEEEEKRSLEERLNRAEKMEALGKLAGGVAHDLNNVLGIVVGYAELAIDGVDKSIPLRRHLENIMSGGMKAAAIVDDLLTLARRGVSGSEVLKVTGVGEAVFLSSRCKDQNGY